MKKNILGLKEKTAFLKKKKNHLISAINAMEDGTNSIINKFKIKQQSEHQMLTTQQITREIENDLILF